MKVLSIAVAAIVATLTTPSLAAGVKHSNLRSRSLEVSCPCWAEGELSVVTADNLSYVSCVSDPSFTRIGLAPTNNANQDSQVKALFAVREEPGETNQDPKTYSCATALKDRLVTDDDIVNDLTVEEGELCKQQIAARCVAIGHEIFRNL